MDRIEGGRPRTSDTRGARVLLACEEAVAKQPAYLAIVGALSERISTGVYAPETRLPSNPQLCTEFEVSPMTVRRALTTLKNQGLISCIQGRGSFVRSLDLSRSTFKLASLSGEWLDGSAEVRLLSVAMSRADAKTAGIARRCRGTACCLPTATGHEPCATNHVPQRIRCLRSSSSFARIAAPTHFSACFPRVRSGQRFPRGELTVRAVNLDHESSEALCEAEGTAALCLEHVFRDTKGHPVSWGCFLLRAESFHLSARLGKA